MVKARGIGAGSRACFRSHGNLMKDNYCGAILALVISTDRGSLRYKRLGRLVFLGKTTASHAFYMNEYE